VNDSDENFVLKIKKLIEKYGWIIIVILAIALVISFIAVIREKARKGSELENGKFFKY
jgi:type II secretory pathway component PulF